MKSQCKICNNTHGNVTYIAREMMFGYRDQFEYFECSKCGCLQIVEVPSNLEKYYPKNYSSFSENSVKKSNFINLYIKRQRTKYFLHSKGILRKCLIKIGGPPNLPLWLKAAKPELNFEILDVGSGSGDLLLGLRDRGFSKLTGIDPFIKEDIFYKNGVRIYKKKLCELTQQFDFIMLHHSFEHVPDPLSILIDLFQKTKPDGLVLIRIPLVSSFAWRTYKTNWVQLDAPRHLFLHSVRSIELLTSKCGFIIENIDYDSKGFQFWGSEQYLRDIPLNDERSYNINPKRSIFSDCDIKVFEKKAEELNNSQNGDQACFYLRKITGSS